MPLDTKIDLTMIPCPGCWGQRVIYHANGDGTYDKHACGQCLGMGEVAKTGHLFPERERED